MDADKEFQTSLLAFVEAHKRDGIPTLTPEVLAIALAEERFKVDEKAILQRAIELVGALCDECFEVLDQFDDCDFEGCVPVNVKDVKATTRLFELSNVASSYLLTKR